MAQGGQLKRNRGKTMKRILFIAAALIHSSATWSGPAAWYKWHHPQADYDVCAQFPPDAGWVAVKGPFQDSACKKPGVPH